MYRLILGNKNYSSWSLRPWLAMRMAGLDFEEEVIALRRPESRANLLAWTPAARAPALIIEEDGATRVVWDSLAILETLAERHPEARLWPEAAPARMMARAVSAEMHAGFQALRAEAPMNVRRSGASLARSDALSADIARIAEIWRRARAQADAGGPFLFGRFSNADAMFAPVASRFRTYGVALDPVSAAYVAAIHETPAMAEWMAASAEEPWAIAEIDALGETP